MFTYKPEGAKVPIKVWMDKIAYHNDEGMVGQLESVAKLPFMFRHVALSPDGHLGYGVPIGGVGDEVYYLLSSNKAVYLKKGKVLYVNGSDKNVFIEFDIPTYKNHDHNPNLRDLGKRGYCWYANKRYVTKDKGKVLKLVLDRKGD